MQHIRNLYSVLLIFVPYYLFVHIFNTRMHSSRMRTAHTMTGSILGGAYYACPPFCHAHPPPHTPPLSPCMPPHHACPPFATHTPLCHPCPPFATHVPPSPRMPPSPCTSFSMHAPLGATTHAPPGATMHAPPGSNHTCCPPRSNHACPPPGATMHAPLLTESQTGVKT